MVKELVCNKPNYFFTASEVFVTQIKFLVNLSCSCTNTCACVLPQSEGS